MPYEDQIICVKACNEMFDPIGHAVLGRQGLERCIAALEADDKEERLWSFVGPSGKRSILHLQ